MEEIKETPTYEQLLGLAGATAQRYGFASGLRKARGDLLRARRRYGMDELRVLKTKKEEVFQKAASLDEARKQIAEITQKIQRILTQMRENTVEELARVSEFLKVVKYCDERVIGILHEVGIYHEYNEIPVEIEKEVEEWKKTKEIAKKTVKKQKEKK